MSTVSPEFPVAAVGWIFPMLWFLLWAVNSSSFFVEKIPVLFCARPAKGFSACYFFPLQRYRNLLIGYAASAVTCIVKTSVYAESTRAFPLQPLP